MKRAPKIYWLIMALTLLILPACSGGNVPTVPAVPTVDTAAIYTQVAETAWAFQTQTAQAVPTATNTPEPSPTPQPTNTLLPTNTLPIPTNTPTATRTVVYIVPNSNSAGPIPSMTVTLIANNVNTSSVKVATNQDLILRAEVENTSNIDLQVVANLTVPDGWGVSENPYSDCPTTEDLAMGKICTISWKFKPLISGVVYLRVYVRGIYTDTAGNIQRITQSPAFMINVVP